MRTWKHEQHEPFRFFDYDSDEVERLMEAQQTEMAYRALIKYLLKICPLGMVIGFCFGVVLNAFM